MSSPVPEALNNIMLGVIANGLTAIIAVMGHRTVDMIAGGRRTTRRRQRSGTGPVLDRAVSEVIDTVDWEGSARLEEVCLFLGTPEVHSMVRQIFASQLSGIDPDDTLRLIRGEFTASLALYLDEDETAVQQAGEQLFVALLRGCEKALQKAVDEGMLAAHEAESRLRHRFVMDELAALRRNVALLTSAQKPNRRAIIAFEERYRGQVATRHQHIVPPHFDRVRRVPVGALYVEPSFLTGRKPTAEETELTASALLTVLSRAVVLGNPGGGKSTFAAKLCYDLASRSPNIPRNHLTPILVVLRDYGAEKKEHHYSLLQFIEMTANTKYQLQPPSGAFEYLLLNGRAFVIFDGLDELLDTTYRQEISGDVESFCTLYPSVPVLVTSRQVGYEQAPLDERRFDVFNLAPFNEQQVKDYSQKWFAADEDLSLQQREEKARGFVEESEIVPDLRSNPLMLALMCNIYRGENYIPRNRPDVYEKCALMLFERWDRGRGISVPLPFEMHISPAMKYLAYWIYSDERLQGGVTEEALVTKATEYLCPRRFEDVDEARGAARQFIDFCRGRAWVFTDSGTTKEGERLYQFTHRTFLEYFTAAHLVRTHPTADRLMDLLRPKIAKREWDVVAQLGFHEVNPFDWTRFCRSKPITVPIL